MNSNKYDKFTNNIFVEYLKEKRSLGYKYDDEELILLRFDNYCNENNISLLNLKKSDLDNWCSKRNSEGNNYLYKRVLVVKQFLFYLLSLGYNVFIPNIRVTRETRLPHIFTEDEIIELFTIIDNYCPETNSRDIIRLANEYKVMFRLIYCCGLRNSECCNIKIDDIDVDNRSINILNSKGNKDRVVYMPEDINNLCKKYLSYISDTIKSESYFLFPGLDAKKAIPNTSIDRVFTRYLNLTSFAKKCNNKPRVHDLRFTFVTKKINEWAQKNINFETMMPYLKSYLGHKNIQDTYYYYHISDELYGSIHSNDTIGQSIIPDI